MDGPQHHRQVLHRARLRQRGSGPGAGHAGRDIRSSGPAERADLRALRGPRRRSPFIATLREHFDTERFDVRQSTQSDGLAFAYGYVQHRVRDTGRVFRSEWALYCEVREGRISTYKMFEDTAALVAAYG
jgi:uncharacterized protein